MKTLFFEKAASGILLAFLLVCVFVISFNIQPVRAQQGTIYIRADGSIDPPTASIQRNGDIYTLTSDILQGEGVWGQQPDVIVIERDNIVFDGSGFAIHGNLNAPYLLIGNGIDLFGRSNVTIQNVNITDFNNGIFLNSSLNIRIRGNNMPENCNCIYLDSSSNSSIIENNVTRMCGIYLDSSSNNSISRNNIGSPPPTYNGVIGIELNSSSTNNSISENDITGNMPGGIFLNSTCDYNSISENDISNNYDFGVRLLFSSEYNSVDGNNITNNQIVGVSFDSSSEHNEISGNTLENNTVGLGTILDSGYSSIGATNVVSEYPMNTVFHNNFITNTDQVNASAIWDNGYPSGGNYWSNYNGTDLYSGPFQNVSGSDGIGDTPYAIDSVNQDNYPLMNPWTPPARALVGDLTGGTPNPWDFVPDGKVDGKDIAIVAMCYGSAPGCPPPYVWNAHCDVNNDSKLDGEDIAIVAMHFGEANFSQPSFFVYFTWFSPRH